MTHATFVIKEKNKSDLDKISLDNCICDKSHYVSVIVDKKIKNIGKMLTGNHFDEKLVSIVRFVIDRFVKSNVKNKANNT